MFVLVVAFALFLLMGVLLWGRTPLLPGKFTHGKNNLEFTDNQEQLENYSTDASWFKMKPEKVYFPRSVADIQSIVAEQQKNKLAGQPVSLTVRAGGTCMSGGSLTEGAIVDMTRHLNKVQIDAKNMTATVEAGAYFRDIEDKAAKFGLMFPAYPSSHRICGIGGMIGNNASGEKSLRGGATGDNILELEVVLADGSVLNLKPKSLVENNFTDIEKAVLALYDQYNAKLKEAVGNVKKAASGYRLDKVVENGTFSTIPLFVGAQGTLGIVTKAVLKLSPIPKHTELVVISADNLLDLPEILRVAFEHNPESLETFDINTFKQAKKHLKGHAKHLLPYINEEAELFILAQFSEDTKEATKKQTAAFSDKLKEKRFFISHITRALDVFSAWQVRRNSFLLMRDHNPRGFRAVPCIEDVIVPVEAIGQFIESLQKILNKHTVYYGFHGHIGDGSLRIIPVFDFGKADAMDNVFALMQDTFALVKKLKGNISADHSDGIIRTPFLRKFYGEDTYEVFEKIKNIYDPENIMNTNKKVSGTLDLVRKYMQ